MRDFEKEGINNETAGEATVRKNAAQTKMISGTLEDNSDLAAASRIIDSHRSRTSIDGIDVMPLNSTY
jgi:hypothetical protein